MTWKKLLLNALLAGFWVALSYVLDDPRLIVVAPILRGIVGYIASKLNIPVPVDG